MTTRGGKYNATALSAAFGSISDEWIIQDCSYLQAGTDLVRRLGRKVRITGFGLQGLLVGGQSNLETDDAYNNVRLVIFIGTTSMASGDWSSLSISNHIVPGQTGVTRVLFDRTYALKVHAPDSTGYVPACKAFNLHIPVTVNVLYNTDAQAYASGSLSLYFALVSDSSAVSNPGFTSGHWYIQFADILP
jgi:hypothetical protein